jgi:hypothetical protein
MVAAESAGVAPLSGADAPRPGARINHAAPPPIPAAKKANPIIIPRTPFPAPARLLSARLVLSVVDWLMEFLSRSV